MELGKRVRVTKGDHKNKIGTITQLIGTGHARKWQIRFENEEEIDFHAKSLAVDDDSDSSVDENVEEYAQAELNQDRNDDEFVANIHENNEEQENDEDELALDDVGWLLQAQQYMLVFSYIFYFLFFRSLNELF